MKNTTALLIFILFCTFYQDFPLVNVFGEIARTPIFLLIIPMLFYIFSFKTVVVSNYTKYFIYYLTYLFVISAVHLLYIIISNQEIIFLNENIIIKTIKMSVYPIFALIYYQFFYTYLKNGNNKLNALLDAICILQVFFAIFLIFEVFFLKTSTPFLPYLHAMPEKYWKVRLLTMEESFIGNIITFFVFVPVFLVNFLKVTTNKKRRVYILSIIIFVCYTTVSESKGYLILLLISILPMVIGKIYKDPKLKRYFVIILPIVLLATVIPAIALKNFLLEQLYTSGSFGTRFTSYLSSIKLFLKHPFGVGWSGFVYFYPEEIRNTLDSDFINKFELFEIKGYMKNTKNLSTKTDFFDGLIFGGLGYVLFYFVFFIRRMFALIRLKKSVFFPLKITLLFTVISGLTYVSYSIKYELWFLLALTEILEYETE